MKEIAQRLHELPQFDRISAKDGKKWVKSVAESDPGRLMWHIGRVGSGFGGSEIGTLLLGAAGKSGPFKNASTLVNEKLMRAIPGKTLKPQENGIVLESAAIKASIQLYGGKIDTDVIDRFKIKTGNEPLGVSGEIDFPWIMADGTRVLVDIKVPYSGEENVSNTDKKFTYAVQLNTYNLLAEAKGLPPFEKLYNIHLEIPTVLADAYVGRIKAGGEKEEDVVVQELCHLLKHERPGLRLHFVEHEINPEIELIPGNPAQPMNDHIKSVASLYWGCVLRGEAPEIYSAIEDAELDVPKMEQLESSRMILESQLMALNNQIEQVDADISTLALQSKGAEKANHSVSGHFNIKRKEKLLAPELDTLLDRYGVDKSTLRIDRKSVTNRDYSVEKLIAHIESRGDDPKQFLHEAPYDIRKVADVLEEKGEAISRFISRDITIGVSRKKTTQQLLQKMEEALPPPTELSNILNESTEGPSQKTSLSITL